MLAALPGAPIRVLICDDSLAYATLLSHWLADDAEIFVVGRANSGREALDRAAELAPDVIVLDHVMFDVAGNSAELTPALRAVAPGAAIVLVSSMPDVALIEHAGAIAAEGHATKASTVDAIRAAIVKAHAARPA